MNYYRVLLNGKDFLIYYEGRKTYLGFYTTRFVVALDPEDAELKAADSVRNDKSLREIVLNNNDDRAPKLFVDEIYEIKKEESGRDYGFGWYEMEGKNDHEKIYKARLSGFGLKRE